MQIKPELRIVKSIISSNLHIGILFRNESYSQEGEDLLINKLLSDYSGFYVDVGAHHPFRYSNTFLLYKRGWRGINIDPDPTAIKLFRTARPEDINLKSAIGRKKEKRIFYVFKDSALNTFKKKNADSVIKSKQSIIIGENKIMFKPLSEILQKYAKHQEIGFLNIDVEGMEMEVLQSNDWKLFKPKVIAVELLSNKPVDKIINEAEVKFLLKRGYSLVARTINTLIFTRKNM